MFAGLFLSHEAGRTLEINRKFDARSKDITESRVNKILSVNNLDDPYLRLLELGENGERKR